MSHPFISRQVWETLPELSSELAVRASYVN